MCTALYRVVPSIGPVFTRNRSKKREKRREKTRENLEIRRCSLDPDPRPLASRRFMGRIFSGRGEKKMTFLLPTQGARSSRRGFTGRFLHGKYRCTVSYQPEFDMPVRYGDAKP
ncbi:hypothetical protein B296_00059101 [Ensete ventricosum]|uniref:Uncharacterized protein n=1 Tax=Ensete ventricosum TaxID=4639 RepID=A0A426XG26_ENSVE|nr:hypothetical protein B296_00059101 [Ensete ventricosum]